MTPEAKPDNDHLGPGDGLLPRTYEVVHKTANRAIVARNQCLRRRESCSSCTPEAYLLRTASLVKMEAAVSVAAVVCPRRERQ